MSDNPPTGHGSCTIRLFFWIPIDIQHFQYNQDEMEYTHSGKSFLLCAFGPTNCSYSHSLMNSRGKLLNGNKRNWKGYVFIALGSHDSKKKQQKSWTLQNGKCYHWFLLRTSEQYISNVYNTRRFFTHFFGNGICEKWQRCRSLHRLHKRNIFVFLSSYNIYI